MRPYCVMGFSTATMDFCFSPFRWRFYRAELTLKDKVCGWVRYFGPFCIERNSE